MTCTLNAVFSILLVAAILHGLPCKTFAQSVPPSAYEKFDKGRRDVIIFVHGVTGNARETWTNATTGAYWPALMRADPHFASANVWVFSYASPKIGNAQNVEEIATKLADELRAQDVLQTHEKVYFLAHSMGGLIVREMLTQLQLPAVKVPMIYFFGTPSAGADLAGLVAAVSANPQFNNLRPFAREADVVAYSRRWLSTAENPNTRYPQKIWSFCSYELEGMVSRKVIVSQQSASYLCTTNPRASLANHASMVKPADRTQEPYTYFAHAFKFARSGTGRLLASMGNLKLHTADSPGFDTERLELRLVSIPRSNFNVRCGESRDGELSIALQASANEKVIAAQASVSAARNLTLSLDPAQIVMNERAQVGFSVAGAEKPSGIDSIFCREGSADVFLRYVVEPR